CCNGRRRPASAQRDGVEGLALARVGAPPDALAVSKPSDLPDRGVHGRVASGPVPSGPHDGDDRIAVVSQFYELRAEVGEGAKQVVPPAPDSVVAVIAAVHPGQDREGFYLLVEHCEQGVEVAVLERLNCSAGEL